MHLAAATIFTAIYRARARSVSISSSEVWDQILIASDSIVSNCSTIECHPRMNKDRNTVRRRPGRSILDQNPTSQQSDRPDLTNYDSPADCLEKKLILERLQNPSMARFETEMGANLIKVLGTRLREPRVITHQPSSYHENCPFQQ